MWWPSWIPLLRPYYDNIIILKMLLGIKNMGIESHLFLSVTATYLRNNVKHNGGHLEIQYGSDVNSNSAKRFTDIESIGIDT